MHLSVRVNVNLPRFGNPLHIGRSYYLHNREGTVLVIYIKWDYLQHTSYRKYQESLASLQEDLGKDTKCYVLVSRLV